MDDIFITSENKDYYKTIEHVAIDRFTGGVILGALFQETVIAYQKPITLNITLENTSLTPKIIEAFENTLKDICTGLLPLGGMTNKGHGFFTGKLLKNNNEIYDYNSYIYQ